MEGRMEGSSHLSLYTLLHLSVFSLPSHPSCSFWTLCFISFVSSASQTWKRSVDVPRNDWRPSKKCTRTLRQTFSVSLTPALCPRISPGKVFQTLKMHDIPTALRGEAHRIDIHAYRACSIRICVCMYITSRRWVGERWEFLYERRTDKSNKEQRRIIVLAIF